MELSQSDVAFKLFDVTMLDCKDRLLFSILFTMIRHSFYAREKCVEEIACEIYAKSYKNREHKAVESYMVNYKERNVYI